MRRLRIVVVYLALLAGANPVAAENLGSLIALAEDDLAKIRFEVKDTAAPDILFMDAHEKPVSLKAYEGKYVVLNFWALWCAPCRHEMPHLDDLAKQLGPQGLAVVTIATGRNSPSAVDRYFAEAGFTHLPKYYDPKMELAAALKVGGLPVTLLIGPDGKEIGRAAGAVVWNSDQALRLFRTWMSGS